MGELCIFSAYVALLAIFVPLHEPWADEAQAWLLSRDLSLWSLVFHALRHEGHPALWYLLLWVPTHLHLSYSCFGWISAAIAAAGVWVLLRLAPFPFYVRALLPFTFFLGYQYSIVARSYVLFPLLGFLVADCYRMIRPRPVRMAVALALLANVSVHGTIVAVGFAALYAWKLKHRERWRSGYPTDRELGTASAIFCVSILFVAVCLWPTRGALPAVGGTLTRIVDRISIADPVVPAPLAHSSAVSQQIPVPPPPAPPPVAQQQPAPQVTMAPAPEGTLNRVVNSTPGLGRLRAVPQVLGYSVSSSWVCAVLFECLVLLYLFRRGEMKLALPIVLLGIFLTFVYSAPWHFGLFWVTGLMVLWAAWDETVAPRAINLQNAVAVCLAILCIFQLPWTYGAFAYDARNPTSPDKSVAAYLRSLPKGTRVAGLGFSVGVQPYFAQNIFVNQPQTFAYLGRDRPGVTVDSVRASHPDLIVADKFQAADLEANGYRQTQEFCGALFFPGLPLAQTCLSTYRAPLPQGGSRTVPPGS
jgi:hypothetical protein